MKKTLLMISVATITIFSVNAFSQGCHGGGGGMNMGGTDHSKMKETTPTPEPTVQTTCPVMGNQVDRTIFADWQGNEKNTPKRVYFCCQMCVEKFKAKPVKYIKKLRKMHQAIENLVQKESQSEQ